jgi:hypothetical protein
MELLQVALRIHLFHFPPHFYFIYVGTLTMYIECQKYFFLNKLLL